MNNAAKSFDIRTINMNVLYNNNFIIFMIQQNYF